MNYEIRDKGELVMKRGKSAVLLVASVGTIFTTSTVFGDTTSTAVSSEQALVATESSDTAATADTDVPPVEQVTIDSPLSEQAPASSDDSIVTHPIEVDESTTVNTTRPAPVEQPAETNQPTTTTDQFITDIDMSNVSDNTSSSTPDSAGIVENVGDATTPAEDAANKVETSASDTSVSAVADSVRVVAPTATAEHTATPIVAAPKATTTASTAISDSVIKTSIQVVPASSSTSVPNESVATPSTNSGNTVTTQPSGAVSVMNKVAVKAGNLADTLLPEAAYAVAWSPIAYALVIVSFVAWTIAYYTIRRRQKMRESQILFKN